MIGPATKAAIARVVSHLPYLKAEGTGLPTAVKDGISAIKSKYADIHAQGDGDPMFTAAGQWAEEEIGKGLEEDGASHAKKSKKDEAEDGDLVETKDTHHKKGHK